MINFAVKFNKREYGGLVEYLVRRRGFEYCPDGMGSFSMVKKLETDADWHCEDAMYRRAKLRFSRERVKGDMTALNDILAREKFDREVVQPFIETRLKFCGEVGELPEYVSTAERKRQALGNNPFIVNHTPFTLP